jgi:hypothetical protein
MRRNGIHQYRLLIGVFLLSALFYVPCLAAPAPKTKDELPAAGKVPSLRPLKAIPVKPGPAVSFKLNPAARFRPGNLQVLAGKKPANTAILINGREVIPANPYNSWYYEYPLSADSSREVTVSAQAKPGQPGLSAKINLDRQVSLLSVSAPRISGIRFDPQTKDIILTIQDPAGVTSYNIYYANDLNSPSPKNCFILAQANYPVSGTGTTFWRDNGAFTGLHPSNPSIKMRFYKLEVASAAGGELPTITISSPQEGEVVYDP